MIFSMSTTPEKGYHCTLWKIDVIKISFLSQIGCILNSQLLYHTTTEISDKQNLQKLLKVSTMCVHQTL